MACQHLCLCEREKAVNILKAYGHLLKPSSELPPHFGSGSSSSSSTAAAVFGAEPAHRNGASPMSGTDPDLLNPDACQVLDMDCFDDHLLPDTRPPSTPPHSHAHPHRDHPINNTATGPASAAGLGTPAPSTTALLALPPCTSCPVSAGGRLTLICLDCIHATCVQHCQEHTHNTEHTFFVCPEHSQVYCSACGDFVYGVITDHAIQIAKNYILHRLPYDLCSDAVLQACSRYHPGDPPLIPCPHATAQRPASASSHNSKDGMRLCGVSDADSRNDSDSNSSVQHHHQHEAGSSHYHHRQHEAGSSHYHHRQHEAGSSHYHRRQQQEQQQQHNHRALEGLEHRRGQLGAKGERIHASSLSPTSLSSGSPPSIATPPALDAVLSSRSFFGLGLRGLSNLGQTCFINVILQGCVHNPLLRNYFLSQPHGMSEACLIHSSLSENHAYAVGDAVEARYDEGIWCPAMVTHAHPGRTYTIRFHDNDAMANVPAAFLRVPGGHSGPNTCLACLLTDFFAEMYTGARQQLSPTTILFAVWKHLRNLAGYAQHDCHEFFIALLDNLHRHLRPPEEPMGEASKRTSVVRSVFTGLMMSDVICAHCNNVSSTYEPFWDISLGVRPHAQRTQEQSAVSLLDCLVRYTSPEELGADARVFCPRCQSRQLARKRLTIAKPPNTLTFHLKRFEHIPRLQKIGNFVEFPASIDIRPFVVRGGNSRDETPITYSLYCVVVHIGKIESGHYICYIKLNHPEEQWVCCDDDVITPVFAEEVMSKPAYMLFYMRDEL